MPSEVQRLPTEIQTCIAEFLRNEISAPLSLVSSILYKHLFALASASKAWRLVALPLLYLAVDVSLSKASSMRALFEHTSKKHGIHTKLLLVSMTAEVDEAAIPLPEMPDNTPHAVRNELTVDIISSCPKLDFLHVCVSGGVAKVEEWDRLLVEVQKLCLQTLAVDCWMNQFRPDAADEVANALLGVLLPYLVLFPPINSDLVANLVRCCGQFRDLHLTSITGADIENMRDCFRNSTFEHLYLDRFPASLLANHALPDHLRRLDITTANDASANDLVDILRSCPVLETCNFAMTGNEVVLDANSRIGELQLNRLTQFGVSYVPCFNEVFLSLLAKCPELSRIAILYCPISATAMCEVISGSESWPALGTVQFGQMSELVFAALEDPSEVQQALEAERLNEEKVFEKLCESKGIELVGFGKMPLD